jgi:hypothetical protein
MKWRGEIVCLTVLLVAGLLVTPALGSMIKADHHNSAPTLTTESVTFDFVDSTGVIPITKEVTIPKSEWTLMNNELNAITASGTSMTEIFTAQFKIFQKHNLVAPDVNIVTLLNAFNKRTNNGLVKSLQNKIHSPSALNNTLIGFLCAITCTIDSGTTVVLGLNTFVNYVGFDIVSFHKGHTSTGIQVNGLVTDSVPPGNYVGFMFGFFGYWFGQKTSTAVYSNVTVAGLTIITLWLPTQ